MIAADKTALEQVRGIVFDIQRYSLHDGPGLRTNVFLKGCGLACRWCSNPEAKNPRPEIAFFEKNCFLCGDCVESCPETAITMEEGRITWDRLRCNQFGRCAEICTAHAFTLIGKEMTAGTALVEVLRDSAFYQGSGGLTLTGGEPTLQPEFAEALLRLAKMEGIHTAMETCGAVRWENIQRLLPHLDLVLFDLKHTDPEVHQRFTGASNGTILDNLRLAAQSGANLIVRVPLIPDFNADRESLDGIARFVQTLQCVRQIHILAYHTLGKAKYHALHIPYELEPYPPMKPEEAEQWAEVLREYGFDVLEGG
ncbi:MAG TPA: glycyl-radical enzyme activating protein [Anaerolineaceae bacterium]|nr:glycyl-radical enzyme activating protein [Anaerolineaceae bacterium]